MDRRSERRLAYLLITPAVVVMLAVTGYPIGYAVWLSLQRVSLTTPDDTSFVGFENYLTVLTDRYWWTALVVTLVITVVSVAVELVLGLAIAIVMHRTIVRKGVVRADDPDPYGIVTVASAFVQLVLRLDPRHTAIWPTSCRTACPATPAARRRSASSSSRRSEKTTPFMALLLLAGLALHAQRPAAAAQVGRCRVVEAAVKVILPLIKPAILRRAILSARLTPSTSSTTFTY